MLLIKVAKAALYGIFLNYYCYYILQGAFIPMGTMLFFAAAFGCIGIHVIRERKLLVEKEVLCWILYGVLAILTSYFAVDQETAMDGAVKYLQRTIITMMIVYICEKDNSIRFALRLMAVTAIACAVAVLLTVDDLQAKLSLSTGANVSANDIGCIMALGVAAVLLAFGNRSQTSPVWAVLKTASIVAMLSVIFLAGSRKSIYAILIMLAAFFLLCGRDYLKSSSAGSLLISVIVIVAAVAFVNEYLAQYVEGSNLYVRIFGRGAEGAAASDEGRVELYLDALREFFRNPLMGLGFNCFDYEYGNYTHSTYVETLACNGMIGILYVAPYWMMFSKQCRLIKLTRDDREVCLWHKEMMVFLIGFLFMGIGIPYMYKDIPCIVLGTFVSWQTLSFDKLQATRSSKSA